MELKPCCPEAAVQPTAGEIAQWVGGQAIDVAEPERRYSGLATLEAATPGSVAFVASPKAARQAAQSPAGLLIVPASAAGAEGLAGRPRVAVAEPWAAVVAIMARLYPDPAPDARVHPTAIVGEGARLGEGVTVGPYCVVGEGASIGAGSVLGPHCIVDPGCAIGAGCRLTARVTLKGRVSMGDRVIVHPGAVLGADGFKFEAVGGRPLKIPQVGAVVIEDDVEIGANTTIDRAFLYETRIGRGTKIDNGCQIGHNVQVGPYCLMAAQVGIAGSTRLGAGCLLGGNVGLADNIELGDGVMIGAASKVHGDHPDGARLMGYPAIDMRDFARVAAAQQRLPELLRRVRELEKKNEALDGKRGK